MDFKRNQACNIQPPTQLKSNHFVNPIAAITNASTPVRTRVIKPGSQLNSTPVNVHKIGAPARSPTIPNKQNDPCNAKLGIKKPKLNQQNINLSPIMALNRKMSEGPQEQRSLTPTGFKRQESLSNFLERKEIAKAEFIVQNLKDSKTESSFRSMLDSRAKTPTRVAFGEMAQKQSNQFSSTMGLRTSGSAFSLLQGLSPGGYKNSNTNININGNNKLKDSRNKLLESRSFQQLINLGTPVNRDDEVLCCNSNEHQKKVKAKYKVIEEPEDDQLLVYCSKCAINLVQKGFKVQDLTQQDLQKMRTQKKPNPPTPSQYHDYTSQTLHKLQIKQNQMSQQKNIFLTCYQKQLDDIDCYYNSLISLIEQQKNKDKQILFQNRDRDCMVGENLESRVNQALGQLGGLLRTGRVGVDQLVYVQDCESLLTEKGFGYRFDGPKCLLDNIQHKFNVFSQIFQSEGRLRLEREDKQVNIANYHSNPLQNRDKSDNALRFSFEKNVRQTRKSPLCYRNGTMNALEQAPEALEGQDSMDSKQNKDQKQGGGLKKAFRTLFPEEEQDCDREQGIHSPTFKQI